MRADRRAQHRRVHGGALPNTPRATMGASGRATTTPIRLVVTRPRTSAGVETRDRSRRFSTVSRVIRSCANCSSAAASFPRNASIRTEAPRVHATAVVLAAGCPAGPIGGSSRGFPGTCSRQSPGSSRWCGRCCSGWADARRALTSCRSEMPSLPIRPTPDSCQSRAARFHRSVTGVTENQDRHQLSPARESWGQSLDGESVRYVSAWEARPAACAGVPDSRASVDLARPEAGPDREFADRCTRRFR